MGNEIAYLMPTKYKIFLGKGALPPYNPRHGGGAEVLRRHLNFRQISHRFTLSFTNPSFQDLNGSHIILKYDDFKSVEVQGWTPLEILIFLHWTCRPTFTTLLGKRRAISHLMAVPKNRGKCKSATISLRRGDSLSASAPPPSLPRQGGSPQEPCEYLSHRLSFPQACAKAWWQSGELSRSGEFKIGGSMESLVASSGNGIQMENSLRNYVNFILWNRFSLCFKTLKPMSFRGLCPLDPRCHNGISNENSTNW